MNSRKKEDLSTFLNLKKLDIENKIERSIFQMEFLEKIKKLKVEYNFSNKKISELLGVSNSFLSQLFSGDKKLNFDIIVKFQKVFDVKFEIECRHNIDKLKKIPTKVVYISNKIDCLHNSISLPESKNSNIKIIDESYKWQVNN